MQRIFCRKYFAAIVAGMCSLSGLLAQDNPGTPGVISDSHRSVSAPESVSPGDSVKESGVIPSSDNVPDNNNNIAATDNTKNAPDDALPTTNAQVKAAREFWRKLNFDDSLLRRLEQNSEIQDQEYEVLLRFLRFLPKLPTAQWRQMTQPVPAWQELRTAPQNWLGGCFQLEGRLRGFVNLSPVTEGAPAAQNPLALRPAAQHPTAIAQADATVVEADQAISGESDSPPNPRARDWSYLTQLAQRGDIDRVYLSQLAVADNSVRIFVFSRRAPQAWNTLVPLDDPVRAQATFLKAHGGDLYFAAANLAWLPPTDLGKLGFDHGLCDSVKPNAQLHLSENDAFYALLSAAAQAPLASNSPAAANRDLVRLLEAPAEQRGKLQVLTGVVDWVIRQPINDPELSVELGFDHYYQLGISQLLPREVELTIAVPDAPAKEGQPPQIRYEKQKLGTLQFIINARELPPGLTPEQLRHQSVRVAGFFYKNIPFRSELEVHNKNRVMLQSPCLFGKAPQPLEDFHAGKRDDALLGWVILGVLGGGISLAAFLYAQSSGKNRAPATSLPVKIELPAQPE